MKNRRYSNSLKTVVALLQMVFWLVATISFSLVINFIERGAKDSPWMKVGFAVTMIALVCFVVCILYMTFAAGRNNKDESIRLYGIDHLPTELLFLSVLLFMVGVISFCRKSSQQPWDVYNSLILTGTIAFVSDCVLIILYLSLVRKIKAHTFFACSFTANILCSLKAEMGIRKSVKRATIQFSIGTVLALFLVWGSFAKGNIWAAICLLAILMSLGGQFLQQAIQRKKILEGILEVSSGKLDYKFDVMEFTGDYRELAEHINTMGEGLSNAVEENVKNERLKTELITNVSHDVKTPLTSIINYINLIKMERIQNERIENYINILEKKSLRLQQLTEDLVEVSKITSGNISLNMQPINMVELIYQTGGEFNEIFEERGLTIITKLPQKPVMIMADGNRIWRVIQNLYNNVAKYALKDTRVYVELKESDGRVEFSIKDISEQELNKTAHDLSERFVRGDESRGTEGNGLGLSIARNLTILMGGTFEIDVDGDLFTVSITFPVYVVQ